MCIAAGAIAVASIATAIAATSRYLSEAREQQRSLLGLSAPAGGLSWFVRADDGMVPQREEVVALQPPDTETDIAARDHGAIGKLVLASLPASGALDTVSDANILTGSIGPQAFRFAPRDLAPPPAPSPSAAPREQEARAPVLLLPRARPQLASLTPPDDLELTPRDGSVTSRTAIYDITARTVYMPNGERLEAHSGYGEQMDDPRYVRVRMRGVTPPNTYKLTMREALFHGTEAIRMTPEDHGAMHGRAGILAHPYLMGPSGQSNGCVSIKDYGKFLAAFKRGEVDRMVVVFRSDKMPTNVAQRTIWDWWKGLWKGPASARSSS